ncbi:MAG: DUF4295 family protein [Mangrovibacterium sp.]
MAKKAVASLQKGAGKGYAKVIKMVKSEKNRCLYLSGRHCPK